MSLCRQARRVFENNGYRASGVDGSPSRRRAIPARTPSTEGGGSAPASSGTAGALKAVHLGGTVVQVGLGQTQIGIDTSDGFDQIPQGIEDLKNGKVTTGRLVARVDFQPVSKR